MHPQALVGLVRPFTLVGPAVGSLAGAAMAAGSGAGRWRLVPVAAGVLAALLATGASNAWNQAFDADIDRVNKPTRPIPSGRASRSDALVLGGLLAVLAGALGFIAGEAFLACVAVGLLATWIYSAPPLRTKRRPFLALVTIAFARGFLVPVAGWSILAVPLRPDPWALGAVTGLFVLGAAATKDFADLEGDLRFGCTTLPAMWGMEAAARRIGPFLWAPFLLYVPFRALGWIQGSWPLVLAAGGGLTALGYVTSRLLRADPRTLARRGENHPAWRAMYLLLLGAWSATALIYSAGT